ncbi:hypothetical protein CLAFUW4_14819 [Fulvia fulva]|nr:hypothetical protein CLAFUR0_14812 [Fulvia fulva]WPV23009.1 hypothetical protein CLAFUW4_14819 [Fulvia fulva]WPV37945.1 hypothetical protein CLAFUW7_14820 [Fulvia fulva]
MAIALSKWSDEEFADVGAQGLGLGTCLEEGLVAAEVIYYIVYIRQPKLHSQVVAQLARKNKSGTSTKGLVEVVDLLAVLEASPETLPSIILVDGVPAVDDLRLDLAKGLLGGLSRSASTGSRIDEPHQITDKQHLVKSTAGVKTLAALFQIVHVVLACSEGDLPVVVFGAVAEIKADRFRVAEEGVGR